MTYPTKNHTKYHEVDTMIDLKEAVENNFIHSAGTKVISNKTGIEFEVVEVKKYLLGSMVTLKPTLTGQEEFEMYVCVRYFDEMFTVI